MCLSETNIRGMRYVLSSRTQQLANISSYVNRFVYLWEMNRWDTSRYPPSKVKNPRPYSGSWKGKKSSQSEGNTPRMLASIDHCSANRPQIVSSCRNVAHATSFYYITTTLIEAQREGAIIMSPLRYVIGPRAPMVNRRWDEAICLQVKIILRFFRLDERWRIGVVISTKKYNSEIPHQRKCRLYKLSARFTGSQVREDLADDRIFTGLPSIAMRRHTAWPPVHVWLRVHIRRHYQSGDYKNRRSVQFW